MNDDEKKAYSKGYTAGKRRKELDMGEANQRKRDAFWRRAFLAALPAAIAAQGWTREDKPMITITDKIQLAADAADAALKYVAKHL